MIGNLLAAGYHQFTEEIDSCLSKKEQPKKKPYIKWWHKMKIVKGSLWSQYVQGMSLYCKKCSNKFNCAKVKVMNDLCKKCKYSCKSEEEFICCFNYEEE